MRRVASETTVAFFIILLVYQTGIKGRNCWLILTIWHMGHPTEPPHPSLVQQLKLLV